MCFFEAPRQWIRVIACIARLESLFFVQWLSIVFILCQIWSHSKLQGSGVTVTREPRNSGTRVRFPQGEKDFRKRWLWHLVVKIRNQDFHNATKRINGPDGKWQKNNPWRHLADNSRTTTRRQTHLFSSRPLEGNIPCNATCGLEWRIRPLDALLDRNWRNWRPSRQRISGTSGALTTETPKLAAGQKQVVLEWMAA